MGGIILLRVGVLLLLYGAPLLTSSMGAPRLTATVIRRGRKWKVRHEVVWVWLVVVARAFHRTTFVVSLGVTD